MESVENIPNGTKYNNAGDDDAEAVQASSKALYRVINPADKTELDIKEVLGNISKAQDAANGDISLKNVALVHRVIEKLLRQVSVTTELYNPEHAKFVVQIHFRSKGGEGINEKDLQKCNWRFQNGKLPRLKGIKGVDSPFKHSEERPSTPQKGIKNMLIMHTTSSVSYAWNLAEKAVSRTGRTWMWTLLPTGQISTLLSFLLFSYVIRASFLTWFLPLALLGMSIIVMLISTLRLVRGRKRFKEFKAWGKFLKLISSQEEKHIDTKKAEENYIVKHVTPVIHFFLAAGCCIMGLHIGDKPWIPASELAILSFLMYTTVMYVFRFYAVTARRNVLVFQILSWAARGFQCGEANQVFGVLTSFRIPLSEAEFVVSLSSIFRALMVAQLMRIATSSRPNIKANVHCIKYVLPLLVAVVWWDCGELFLCHSSLPGFARAGVEFVMILFAMPLVSVFALYGLLRGILSVGFSRVGITAAVVMATTVYFILWHRRGSIFKKVSTVLEKSSLKRSISIFAFLSLGYVMLYYRPSGLKVKHSGLAWSDYSDLCLNSGAVSCHEFRGYDVTWEGRMDSVIVADIENKFEDLLSVLPKSLALWSSCRYGIPYPDAEFCSKTDLLSRTDVELCKLAKVASRPCSVRNHNIYRFQVTVKMSSVGDTATYMNLDLSHDFAAMLFDMEKGMTVKFRGILTGEKGAISVHALYYIEDGETAIKAENRVRGVAKTLDEMLDDAVHSLFGFLLYPFVSLGDS